MGPTMAGNMEYCFKPGQFEAECYYDGEGSNSMSTGSSMTGESTEPCMTQGNTGGPTSAPGASTSAAGPTSAPGGSSSAPGVCKCGVKKTSRIVGGTEVDPKNKYPWMAA